MTVLKSIMPRFANRGIMTVDILGGNPTPVQGILEKILPEVLQNLPKAVGRGQILEGRGQDFFQQFRGMRGWISA